MFGADFLWGCATAGRQVERPTGTADWDVFVSTPAIRQRVHDFHLAATLKPVDYSDPGASLSHEDLGVLRVELDRLVALGFNAYRFSLEWDRVQPADPMAIDGTPTFVAQWRDHYLNVVREIITRGMTPVISLNHMSLPTWVLMPPAASRILSPIGVPHLPVAADDDQWHASLRGWETDETVAAYVEFVRSFAQSLKNTMRDAKPVWLTLNEPIGSMVGAGYLGALWCPGFGGEADRGKRVCLHLLKAHVLAFQALKAIDATWQVGFAHAMLYATPTSFNSVLAGALAGGAATGAVGAAAGAALGAAGGALAGALLGAAIFGPVGAIIGAIVGAIAGAIAGGVGGGVAGALAGGAVGAVVGGVGNVQQQSTDQFDYFYNEWMLRALAKGEVDADLTVGTQRTAAEWDDAWQTHIGAGPRGSNLDFVGLNYYRRVHVYYSPLATMYVPYTGGVFNNDMAADPDPHGVLNELGWEVYPSGLSAMLRRIKRDYDKPILITENGTPEALDANRAPNLVAHVDEIQAVAGDSTPPTVLGYMHWSSAANWEWHEDYHEQARFGLYCVEDRAAAANRVVVGGVSTPRRQLTEGGVAFQSLIGGLNADGARARFGSVSSGGERVDLPTLTHGAMWEGSFDGVTVKLFLDTQPGTNSLIGLLYYSDVNLWRRVDTVLWGGGQLSFVVNGHPVLGIPTRSASLTLAAGGGAFAGQVTDRETGSASTCNLARVVAHGLWLPTAGGGSWSALAMHRFFDGETMVKRLLPGDGRRWEAFRASGSGPLNFPADGSTFSLAFGLDTRDLTVSIAPGSAGTLPSVVTFRRATSSLGLLAEP